MFYKRQDIETMTYYMMPKFLFWEDYSELNNNDRVIYTMLFNNFRMSLENGWVDEDDNVYFKYTVEKIMQDAKVGRSTVISSKKKLAKVGLLKEVRTGNHQSNHFYLLKPSESVCFSNGECLKNKPLKSEKHTLRSPKNKPLKSENHTPEVCFSDPNKNYFNNNNSNNNNIESSSSSLVKTNSVRNSNYKTDDDEQTRKSYEFYFEVFPSARKSAINTEIILADIEEFGNELYQWALRRAVEGNADSPNYLQRILTEFRNLNIKTVAEAKAQYESRGSDGYTPQQDKGAKPRAKFGPMGSRF